MDDYNNRVQTARRADLGEFLVTHHPDDVKVTGNCVYLKEHDSLYTKFGFCGYTRFSSQETGNSIDFLVSYMGYSFVDAVNALCQGKIIPLNDPPVRETGFDIPKPETPPYKRVFAYMTKERCIPPDMVRSLFQEKLLYQEAGTGNAIFLSRDRQFCELRGTCTYARTEFHGIRRSSPRSFWSTKTSSEKPKTAYICEGAIDAISLRVLHESEGHDEPAAYISIGGVRNQQAIDRIRTSVHTVLAVDNDTAGQECRDRNPSLESIIPIHKDWNEDLQLQSQNIPFMSKM